MTTRWPTNWLTRLFAWLVPGVVLIVLLFPVLAGQFFADDFQFVLADPGRDILGSFNRLHPYTLYRPLQLSVVALCQALAPGSTLPIHLVTILMHLGLVALLAHALNTLRAPRLVVGVTVLVLVVSQLNAPALGGNDTLSLVMGTLFGSLAVWWFHPSVHRGGGRRTGLGLTALVIALLSKESSIGYVPLLVVMSFQSNKDVTFLKGALPNAPRAVHYGRDWLRALSVVVLTAGYLAWRQHLGAEGADFGPNGNWHVGPGAMVNLVMLWAATLVPVSTTDLILGVVHRDWRWPVAAAIGLVVSLVVLGIGLSPRRWGGALRYMAAASVVVAPVLFRGHISELYAYALMPATALLFGYGYGGALIDRRRTVRLVAALSLALFAIGQATTTRVKSRQMAENGERAVAQMNGYLRTARGLPSGGTLILFDEVPTRPQYSVYLMDGLRLTPVAEVAHVVNRPDIRVKEQSAIDRGVSPP